MSFIVIGALVLAKYKPQCFSRAPCRRQLGVALGRFESISAFEFRNRCLVPIDDLEWNRRWYVSVSRGQWQRFAAEGGPSGRGGLHPQAMRGIALRSLLPLANHVIGPSTQVHPVPVIRLLVIRTRGAQIRRKK